MNPDVSDRVLHSDDYDITRYYNEKSIAASDELSSDIWKRLTILKTEAWFDTVNAIAMELQVTAKLEKRYRKSAIIYGIDGCRIGRIWQIDENYPICYDLNN